MLKVILEGVEAEVAAGPLQCRLRNMLDRKAPELN